MAVQLYLFTLGDPTLQEGSLPACGFMLFGLPGLHLGSCGGPRPAEVQTFPGRLETLLPLLEQQTFSDCWTRWSVPDARLDDERNKQFFLLSYSRERYSSWNVGGL